MCRMQLCKRTVDVLMILLSLTFFGSSVFCIEAQSTRTTATQSEQLYMLRFLILKERRERCKEKATNNRFTISSSLGLNSYPVDTVMHAFLKTTH